MANPSGPYPGRQLFLGITTERKPCFAYLVTGRSPESRQRKAVALENTVRMVPLAGDTALVPLRFHYPTLKYDDSSGLAVITNGLQTEAIFETYKLFFEAGTPAITTYLQLIMEGAKSEPDSMHTPRISGVISGKTEPTFLISIKTLDTSAAARQVSPAPGTLCGISTYRGVLERPQPTDPEAPLPVVQFAGKTAKDLAGVIWDISAANYKGDDIRVCALGGVRTDTKWEVAIINKY